MNRIEISELGKYQLMDVKHSGEEICNKFARTCTVLQGDPPISDIGDTTPFRLSENTKVDKFNIAINELQNYLSLSQVHFSLIEWDEKDKEKYVALLNPDLLKVKMYNAVKKGRMWVYEGNRF